MTVDPVQITADSCRWCDHDETVAIKTRDGNISFDTAFVIKELGVDDLAIFNSNVITGNTLKHSFCITTHDHDFTKAGHIKHTDIFADGFMFSSVIVKPVLAFP